MESIFFEDSRNLSAGRGLSKSSPASGSVKVCNYRALAVSRLPEPRFEPIAAANPVELKPICVSSISNRVTRDRHRRERRIRQRSTRYWMWAGPRRR